MIHFGIWTSASWLCFLLCRFVHRWLLQNQERHSEVTSPLPNACMINPCNFIGLSTYDILPILVVPLPSHLQQMEERWHEIQVEKPGHHYPVLLPKNAQKWSQYIFYWSHCDPCILCTMQSYLNLNRQSKCWAKFTINNIYFLNFSTSFIVNMRSMCLSKPQTNFSLVTLKKHIYCHFFPIFVMIVPLGHLHALPEERGRHRWERSLTVQCKSRWQPRP